MLKFSPSLDAVLGNTGLSFADRIRASKKLGFPAFEFWSWWDKNIDEVDAVRQEVGIEVASFCTKFVSLVQPEKRSAYLEGLEQSVEVAGRLGCPFLISQTGNLLQNVPREAQHESLVQGLKASAPILEKNGVTLIVEPLNVLVDHAGYYLVESSEAFQMVSEVNSPNVKIVFDIYHQQITEGNLIPNITNNMDKIAYFHVADHPGRRDPGTGEIHYHNVLRAIKDTGFDGYVGLEYFPQMNGLESLERFLQTYAS